MNNVASSFCVKPIVWYWSKTYFCAATGHCRLEGLVSQSTTRRQSWWITLDSLVCAVSRPIDGFLAPSGIFNIRDLSAFQFVGKTLKCHKLNSEGLRLMQNCIKKRFPTFSSELFLSFLKWDPSFLFEETTFKSGWVEKVVWEFFYLLV